jgi:hypothetical protein
MREELRFKHYLSTTRLVRKMQREPDFHIENVIRGMLSVLHGYTEPIGAGSDDRFVEALLPEFDSLCDDVDVQLQTHGRDQSLTVLSPYDLSLIEEFLGKYRRALS